MFSGIIRSHIIAIIIEEMKNNFFLRKKFQKAFINTYFTKNHNFFYIFNRQVFFPCFGFKIQGVILPLKFSIIKNIYSFLQNLITCLKPSKTQHRHSSDSICSLSLSGVFLVLQLILCLLSPLLFLLHFFYPKAPLFFPFLRES